MANKWAHDECKKIVCVREGEMIFTQHNLTKAVGLDFFLFLEKKHFIFPFTFLVEFGVGHEADF